MFRNVSTRALINVAETGDAPATVDQTKIAIAAETLPPANEAAPAAPAIAPVAEAVPAAVEQTSLAASPDLGVAATKIATLGGPPVTIEPQRAGKVASAKPDKSVNEKRLQVRRAALRRRMAARARLARQALLQQQAKITRSALPFNQGNGFLNHVVSR